MNSLIRIFCLFLYYGFAYYLPASNQRIGRWARPVRRWICKPLFASAGENINIEARADFGKGSQIEIGDNSNIGVDAKIYGPITIGRDVMMGPEVVVITTKHNVSRTDVPMIEQGVSPAQRVIIEDDVWIGQRVTILPGVRIGKGAIVGACAVVTKDVMSFTVVAGNPAREIRDRRTK